MKIQTLSFQPYKIPFSNGWLRKGFLIELKSNRQQKASGDIAPLPNWSKETVEEALKQCEIKKEKILQIDWSLENYFEELKNLDLYPSVSFGLESALLTLLDPLPAHAIEVSALLMGSCEEILDQALLREKEGYTSAKIKVGNLKLAQAEEIIYKLKERFRLRIDVNRAWKKEDSLSFFKQFPLDAFDYIEEPSENPKDFIKFSHPLAIDESFPKDLSLKELEEIPNIKALIYKPMLQGGMLQAIPLSLWAKEKGIDFVLSSSFESNLGILHIASMAHRLSLKAPVGIGTFHHAKKSFGLLPQFLYAHIQVPKTENRLKTVL